MTKSPLISFKMYKEKEQKQAKQIVHSGTTPYIHYQHISIGAGEQDTSVGNKPKTLDESAYSKGLPKLEWRNQNDNAHLGSTSVAISSALNKKGPKLNWDKHRDQLISIENYTRSSKNLNKYLLKAKKKVAKYHTQAKQLHSIFSKPLGHNLNLYSGVGSDPRTWEKTEEGHVRLGAFTSMTHDKNVAHAFAHSWSKKGVTHIIHLHAKSTDMGMHIRKHSIYKAEHETVLPAETHIKPHPDYDGPEVHTASDGSQVHVHHYVIHKQTHSDDYTPRPT